MAAAGANTIDAAMAKCKDKSCDDFDSCFIEEATNAAMAAAGATP